MELIDKQALLKYLYAKMDRCAEQYEGEKLRGLAGAVGVIVSGKYDVKREDVAK